MGLDGVELIMAAEEAFGIQISDEEAEHIRTPRLFYEIIARKLRVVDSNTCLSQRAFHLLRRTFRRQHPVPRRQFRPETPLDQLISKTNRKSSWQQLREHVGSVAWPKLKLPGAISIPVTALLIIAWLVVARWLIHELAGAAVLPIMLSVVGMSFVAYAVFFCLKPFETSLSGQTVGTLAQYLVAYSPELFAPPSPDWTMERIRAVMRNLIVEQLGVKPDFDDDADFINDLGVD